jgi:prepilin-type N-terminal cleavage/methylation domain-containing protein
MKNTRYISGFTLIELLVVTSIMAVIIVASSFGFVNILKNRRDTARIAHVSAIQTSLVFYLSEFKDFSAILASDGVPCSTCYGQIFDEAVYYSTPVYPGMPGKHSWSQFNQHVAKYSSAVPADPLNKYTDWLGNGEPDYTSPTLIHGYIVVRLRSITVDQPTGCAGEEIKSGYLIETVLENETNKRTDKTREPRLFGCIPAGDPQEHLFRAWGALK